MLNDPLVGFSSDPQQGVANVRRWCRQLVGALDGPSVERIALAERGTTQRPDDPAGWEHNPYGVAARVPDVANADVDAWADAPEADYTEAGMRDRAKLNGKVKKSDTIAERLERLRAAGEAWTSQRDVAKRLGCSVTGVCAALKKTVELTAWSQPNPKTPKRIDAEGLSGKVVDGLAAASTADEPRDDYDDDRIEAALAALIDNAGSDERTKIHEMDDEGQRRLAVVYLEHQADEEPSPLDAAGRPAKVYKQV